MKVYVELKEQSIVDFYQAVAEQQFGSELVEVQSYDCTKIKVSEERFEKIREYYEKEYGMLVEEFAMQWIMRGPKVDCNLSETEVEVEDGFAEIIKIERRKNDGRTNVQGV